MFKTKQNKTRTRKLQYYFVYIIKVFKNSLTGKSQPHFLYPSQVFLSLVQWMGTMLCHPREGGAVSEEGGLWISFSWSQGGARAQPQCSTCVTGTAGKGALAMAQPLLGQGGLRAAAASPTQALCSAPGLCLFVYYLLSPLGQAHCLAPLSVWIICPPKLDPDQVMGRSLPLQTEVNTETSSVGIVYLGILIWA